MINSVKARTPILALILFVFAMGYTFAETRVVVIPLGADAAPQSLAFQAGCDQWETLTATTQTLRVIGFTAPVDGMLIANSTVSVTEISAGDGVHCSISITPGLPVIDSHYRQTWQSPGASGREGQLAGTRGISMNAGQYYRIILACAHTGYASSNSTVYDSSLTAIFTPSA